jgi:hypothetical protein
MSEAPTEELPRGILTEDERQTIASAPNTPAARAELLDALQDRLHATLVDFSILYPWLRDGDLEAVFNPNDPARRRDINTACQDLLGLLYLGMVQNDDAIEMRIADGFTQAARSIDRHLMVDIDLISEPMGPVETTLQRLDAEGMDGLSFAEFEWLLHNPDADAERLARLARASGFELTPAEIEAEREGLELERYPQTVLTDVTVTSTTDEALE